MAGATCAALAGKPQLPTFSKHLFFWAGSDKAALIGATYCRMRTRLP